MPWSNTALPFGYRIDRASRSSSSCSAGARPANIGRFATSERSTEAIDILVPIGRGAYPRPKQASTACLALSPVFGAEIALAQHRQDQPAISHAREPGRPRAQVPGNGKETGITKT